MSAKVKDIVAKMEVFNYDGFVFYSSVDQLLSDYPEFVFNAEVRGTTDVFHDLEKKITPHGVKNLLLYDIEKVMPLIKAEHLRLLTIRNALIKILAIIPAEKNKKLILAVLEDLFKISLNTGGGATPAVLRVIKLYETEGKITKKRKAEAKEVAPAQETVFVAAAETMPGNVDTTSISQSVSPSSSSSSSASPSLSLVRTDSSEHINQKAKIDSLNEWWDCFERDEEQQQLMLLQSQANEEAESADDRTTLAATVNPMDDIPLEGDFGLFSDDDFRQDQPVSAH